MKLNTEQKEIINHTIHRAANNLFCGGSKDMDALVDAGLMEFVGKPTWALDGYYRVTRSGREKIKEIEAEHND